MTTVAIAGVALGLLACTPASAPSAPAPALASSSTSDTAVIDFTPTPPPASVPSQPGDCWTRSIASERDGAWRCMAGNSILDPCFSSPSPSASRSPGTVVCGADPATGAPGFVLTLSKPLPTGLPQQPSSLPPAPWRLRLADGEACARFTGTRPSIGNDIVEWYCEAPGGAGHAGGLVTHIEKGRPWEASWYPASEGTALPGATTARPKLVAVEKAWR